MVLFPCTSIPVQYGRIHADYSSDDLLHSASTAGAEDAGNRPISAMTVCLMQAIMDVALVWPLVVLLLRRQGDRTGRTNRSQVRYQLASTSIRRTF